MYPLSSVLQFVPRNVDVGFCNFSKRIEKGLTTAFREVSKHQEFYNFTVQVRRLVCFVSVPLSPYLCSSCILSSQKDELGSTDYSLPSRSCRTMRLCYQARIFFPYKIVWHHIISLVSGFLKKLSKMMIYIQKHY